VDDAAEYLVVTVGIRDLGNGRVTMAGSVVSEPLGVTVLPWSGRVRSTRDIHTGGSIHGCDELA
jgi:hypothetical protein